MLIPLHSRKIILPHTITYQKTINLIGKEFTWSENMNKLWQQQGKGENTAVKGLFHIIQTHVCSIASSNCDIQATTNRFVGLGQMIVISNHKSLWAQQRGPCGDTSNFCDQSDSKKGHQQS